MFAFLKGKDITDRSVPVASNSIEESFAFFLFIVPRVAVTQFFQPSDDLFHIGLKRLVAQDEFFVDVKSNYSLKVVVVKEMEHDGASSNEGLDIGVVILQVFWEAFFNFGKELAFSSGPLEGRTRSRFFGGHDFKSRATAFRDSPSPFLNLNVEDAARRGWGVVEELMETVKVASLGQVTDALFNVGGQYRNNT